MLDRASGKGGACGALKAVFWAFLGIRKGAASEADFASLKLWQVIVAGVAGAALFVALVVTLVKVVAGRV